MTTLPLGQLLPFILFAFVASITPGPTNLLVLGNAMRHGLAASLAIAVGAASGVAGMLLVVGLGLGEVLLRHPPLQAALACVGMAWMGWLAWQLWRSPAVGVQGEAGERRPGALTGAGLQLVNPKAWMMALSATSLFAGTDADGARYGLYALVFLLVALPCLTAWALLGRGAARLLPSPQAVQRFNQGMALLLVTSAGMALLG
ncbi:LysE family translocator [Pseudomonas sp. Q1-7]|uniref:LysE family translocator n=1 Tax=Pseudomonas sp. Q1-7 TaxID=3020843 RepID=UPI0022FFCA76|nr:LysE family translocator [Pseudomonas sp. Q1-7]